MPAPRRFRSWLALCALLAAPPAGAGALVDPTRPASLDPTATLHTGAPRRGWTLDSTLVAPDRRIAVINGKRVAEGESVDGAQVIQIRQLDVLLQAGGRRVKLRLLPDIVQEKP
ncbi:MAG: general secretion pathway protein GspB [Gammaproteobacteria bacterium]